MHIKTQSNHLASALKTVLSFMPSGEGRKIVVLTAVAGKKSPCLRVESFSEGYYAAYDAEAEVLAEGTISLDGKLLAALKVKGALELILEKDRMRFKSGRTTGHIETLPDTQGSSYKKVPSDWEFPAAEFIALVSSVRLSGSPTDASLTRIRSGNKKIEMVTADNELYGVSVARQKAAWAKTKMEIIMQTKVLYELAKAMSNEGETSLTIDGSTLCMSHGKMRVRLPVLGIEFPTMDALIDQISETTGTLVQYTVSLAQIKDAVSIVTSTVEGDADLSMQLDAAQIQIRSKVSSATVSHRIKVANDGKPLKKELTISVSAPQLLGLTSVMEGEKTQMMVYESFVVFNTDRALYELPRTDS